MPTQKKQAEETLFALYSSLAQLAERVTVNHDVAGSSPAGGARKPDAKASGFQINPSLRTG